MWLQAPWQLEAVAGFYEFLKREIMILISLEGPRTQREAQPNHSGCGSDRQLFRAAKAVAGQGDWTSVPSPIRCVEGEAALKMK